MPLLAPVVPGLRPEFTFLALTLTLCALGCDRPQPPDGTYTTRGRLEGIGRSAVIVRHEAIADFRDREGEASPMDSMAMRFFRPAELRVDGLAEGDPVELTFEVRWRGEHTLTLTGLRELPANTELVLATDDH